MGEALRTIKMVYLGQNLSNPKGHGACFHFARIHEIAVNIHDRY